MVLLDTLLVGGDGGALDADVVLLDRMCSIDGNLVLGLSTIKDVSVRKLSSIDLTMLLEDCILLYFSTFSR